jgi:Sulfotransferase family
MSSLSPATQAVPAFDLEVSDRRYLANRLIRRLNHARRAALRPGTMATLARFSEPANQQRMLFVVGAARSGTTAMQMALNGSDDVFLLTEANLFRENLMPGFQERYDARYLASGLTPSKETQCPRLAPENSTWVETLDALLSHHRFVGEKVAFGHFQAERFVSEYLAFQYRHFNRAAYVLMFRNPRDAILSPREAWGIENLVPWARSYIAGTRGLIRLHLNFPRTVPAFLETVGPATFEAIEQCLDSRLPALSRVMGSRAESPRVPERVPTELRKTVADLEELYPMLREAIERPSASDPGSTLESIDSCLAGLGGRLRGAPQGA